MFIFYLYFCTFSLVLKMILPFGLKTDSSNVRNVKKYLRPLDGLKCMARYHFRREELSIFVGYGQLN